MRVFVLDQTGNRYGPVDIATLNQWVRDGRVIADTQIMIESTGKVVPASLVPGINLDMAPGAGFGQTGRTAANPVMPNPYGQMQGRSPNDLPIGFPNAQPSQGYSGPFGGSPMASGGSGLLTTAYALCGISLLICFCGGAILSVPMCIVALVLTKNAEKQGSPGTSSAFLFGLFCLGLNAIGLILNIMSIQLLSSLHS